MNTREIVEKYYEYANAGNWDAWCDLFAEDAIFDEQLAGRVQGREVLRGLMRGFPQAYAKFVNTPSQFVVDGNRAAVVSHISALAMKYQDQPIEAEAMNFYQIENGQIKYAANFHDSKPFAPFLKQISEG